MPKKNSGSGTSAKRGGKTSSTRQVAALPYRRRGDDRPEFLLVTTRATRRWTIPKGWKMKKKSDADAAALEAFEEAGIKGQAADAPVGRYSYFKRFESHFELVDVDVYALEVDDLVDDWPENAERERAWFSLEDACLNVTEPELETILSAFALTLTQSSGGSRSD